MKRIDLKKVLIGLTVVSIMSVTSMFTVSGQNTMTQNQSNKLLVNEVIMPIPEYGTAAMLAGILKSDSNEDKEVSADVTKEQKYDNVNSYSLLKCTVDGKSICTKTKLSEWFATEKPVNYIIPTGSEIVFRTEKADTGKEAVTAIKKGSITIVFESGKKITIEANRTYNYKVVDGCVVIIP